MTTNIVGGLRSRLIFDSIYSALSGGLTGLGWLGGSGSRRNKPIHFVVEEQDVTTEVPLNTLALIDSETRSMPWELGSQLAEDTHSYYLDFFGESDAVSKHIMGDLRDLLMGKMPSVGLSGPVIPVIDLRQPTPTHLFGVQIVNVRLDRAHNVNRPWLRHWYSISFDALDYYNDENDPSAGASTGTIVQPPTGEEMIRKFDFTFATPDLTTGVVVYNPTVGDILLDAWIEIDTAFNGTTPMADISQFNGGNHGWFADLGTTGPVSLLVADGPEIDSSGIISAGGFIDYTAAGSDPVTPIPPSGLSNQVVSASATAGAFNHLFNQRIVPAKFTSPNPVKLVVSQDGLKGGAATGATAGAGTVYFLTGTPQ